MPDQVTIPFAGQTTDAGAPFGIPFGTVPWVPDPNLNYAPQDIPDTVNPSEPGPTPTQPREPIPPAEPKPEPGPPIYTALPAFFGALESRRPRLTKLGRLYEEAVKIGTKAIFKGALEATTSFFKRGATRVSEAAAASEINIGAQALGKEVIVRGSPTAAETVLREVLRRNAEEIAGRGASYIGRIVAAAAGLAVGGLLAVGVEMLLPNRAGYTDEQERELLRQAADMERRAVFTFDNSAADRALRTARTPIDLLPTGQYPLGFPVDEIQLPDTVVRRSLLQRVLPYVADELPEALRQAARDSAKGTPVQKAPAATGSSAGSTAYGSIPQVGPPAPTSSSPSSPTGPGRLPRPGVRWGMIAIGAGSIVAANTLLPRLFGNPYTGSQTPAAPAPSTPPSQNVTPTIQPSLGTFAVGNYSVGSSSGYCEPRPRGPRRKCLERAPVAWRSGSRKGKAAGTKCIRYANRRTSS